MAANAMVCDCENFKENADHFCPAHQWKPFLAESYSPLDSNFCSKTASAENLRDHWLLQSPCSSDPLSVFPMSELVVRNEIAHYIFFQSWPRILKSISVTNLNFLMYHHEVMVLKTKVKMTQYPSFSKKIKKTQWKYSTIFLVM